MNTVAPVNPIFHPIRRLYQWVIRWADHPHALKALAFLSFIEASFFPIPPDPLLVAIAMTKPRRGLFYGLVTTVFSVLGAVLGYFIGVFAWQHLSGLFFEFVLSQEKFNVVVEQFSNNVFLTIFVAGFSPIPFKVFTIAGGVAGVPMLPFILASILSRGLRFCIEGGLILVFGRRIQYWIDNYFERLTIAVSLFLVIIVVIIKLLL